jgi:hypothetical protein
MAAALLRAKLARRTVGRLKRILMVDKLIVGVGEKRVVVLVYRLIVVLSECVAAMASTENTTGKRVCVI